VAGIPSVGIFPLHPVAYTVFTGIGMPVFKLAHSFQGAPRAAVLSTSGALFVCALCTHLLR
jgi:hypothetical protein